jgi:hypothetical protein
VTLNLLGAKDVQVYSTVSAADGIYSNQVITLTSFDAKHQWSFLCY